MGSYPLGASPYGVLDLAGNVADWYDAAAYSNMPATNPDGPPGAKNNGKVLRGGSWISFETDLRTSERGHSTPESLNNNVGFRCAQSPSLTTEIVVDGTTLFNDTGIQIRPGQLVIIEYVSGEWRAGPAEMWPPVGQDGDPQVPGKALFPVVNQAIMTLIAGLDTSQPFVVGERTVFSSDAAGELWLGPNDDNTTDNAGRLVVRVTVVNGE